MADIDTSKEAVARIAASLPSARWPKDFGPQEVILALVDERDQWRNTALNKLELMNSTALRAKDAEIATLLARVKELEEALHEIKGSASPDHWVPQYQHCVDVARAALSREGGE